MTIIQITNKLMKDTLIIRIQYNTNETKQIYHYPVQDCQKLICLRMTSIGEEVKTRINLIHCRWDWESYDHFVIVSEKA